MTLGAFVWHHPVLHRVPLPARADRSPRPRKTGPATNIIAGIARRASSTHWLADARHRGRASCGLATTSGADAAACRSPASSARPSRPWACSPPRPTSWRWTPSARSPTTPAASSRWRQQPEEVRQQDRPPGRRGQHHQGAHQGLRGGFGGPGGVPALLGVHGRGQAQYAGRHVRAPSISRKPGGVRRRPAGAMLVFLFSAMAIQAVGKAAAGHHRGGAPAVPRASRASWRGRRSPTTASAWTSSTKAAPARDGPPRPAGRAHADRRRRRASRFLELPGRTARRRDGRGGLLMVGTIAGILMATVPQQRRRRLGQRQEVHRDWAT